MAKRTMAEIIALEARVPMYLPEIGTPVKVMLNSNVIHGVTIEMPVGAPMYELHRMLASGANLCLRVEEVLE